MGVGGWLSPELGPDSFDNILIPYSILDEKLCMERG